MISQHKKQNVKYPFISQNLYRLHIFIYYRGKTMQRNDFLIHKQSFIKSRREDIQQYYDFSPKELGKGAYGVVYKAKEKIGGQEWRAIKKIPKKSVKQPQVLINQIQILKSLDHPTCIKLYETFEDQNNVFLVTDLCEGGELFERLDADGNFSQQDARRIFIQIMEAVNYCHFHNIAHRDLKPQNFLFLNKNGLQLKLIDFGLAYRWKTDMRDQLEANGEKKLVGTSYYIAPEIINGSYDQRCDEWSAGVILYILLTAVPPFDGDTDKEILQQVRRLKYDINIPEMKTVSKGAKDLVCKILQPQYKRITANEIFNEPWIQKETNKEPLKLNFTKLCSFSKYSKLKKIAATYIATQLSEKEVENLNNLFKQMDLNHDGQISMEELKQALKDEKNQPTVKDLASVMESIDTDKNGRINYTEFLASCIDHAKLFTQEHIKSVFKMIDKDGNGFVQRNQLQEVLQNSGTNLLNGKSVDEIIDSCDKDGNGMIDYDEFRACILG